MQEKSRLKAETLLCGEEQMICIVETLHGLSNGLTVAILPISSHSSRILSETCWLLSGCTCILRSLSCQSWRLILLHPRWLNSIRNRLEIHFDRWRFRSRAQLKPKIHPSALFSVLYPIVYCINLSRRYVFALLLARLSSPNLALITLIITDVFSLWLSLMFAMFYLTDIINYYLLKFPSQVV